jgi:hypothetical protein
MKALAALPPKTLLQVGRLLRIGALIAATWAFREVFEHRAASAIGAGFGLWAALEISAYRLRKWADDRSRHLEGN